MVREGLQQNMNVISALIEELADELVRESAADQLAELGQEAVPQLIDALARPDILQVVTITLWSIGKPAVDPLINALGSVRGQHWLAIGRCLSGMPTDWALWPLVDALEHANSMIKMGAIRSLAADKYRGTVAVSRLLDCTRDSDERVRASAAGALGRIGDRVALKRLQRMATNDTATVGRHSVAYHAQVAARQMLDGG